jgi:hypothetical protein
VNSNDVEVPIRGSFVGGASHTRITHACTLAAMRSPGDDLDMRIDGDVTAASWIPSEAVTAVAKPSQWSSG